MVSKKMKEMRVAHRKTKTAQGDEKIFSSEKIYFFKPREVSNTLACPPAPRFSCSFSFPQALRERVAL